jgi:integrase
VAHVQKRNGKYQARFRGPDGKEHTKRFERKVDAEKWLVTNGSDLVRGSWIDPTASSITLRDFADEWLERKLKLAARTRELYGHLLNKHIYREFGDVQLGKILPSKVDAWFEVLAQQHPSTAAKAYRLLSQLMIAARRDRLIHENPCQLDGAGTEHSPERPTASTAEVNAIADAMPPNMRLTVLLAAWCQLRRAEVLGLRRRDIDALHGTITIAQTRVKMMSGEMVDKAPKSGAGRRTIAIPSNVFGDLEEHLDRAVEGAPDSLVFTGSLGEPLKVRALDSAWQRARASIQRSDLHFHDLRHSGLTWSAATGATVAELMRRAGHASPTAAFRYQHATEDRDRVLADALAKLDPRAEIHSLADKPRTAAKK